MSTGQPTSQTANEEITYLIPENLFTEDTLTKGNWPGRYGNGGYVLFNHTQKDLHTMHLPNQQFTLEKNANCLYPNTDNDPRAPLANPEPNAKRSLGVIYTQDPAACMQTMVLNYTPPSDTKCRLSLYFVDYEQQGRRCAIEIFDAKTHELIAPVHFVNNYAIGRYITFPVDRPIRIRINHIRGDNAALAAFFVD